MLKTKPKKKDKKKKFNKFDIQPQKHKREDNLNYYSEEIVKEIIDKIISLSFSKLFKHIIEKKISDYCITGIQNTLNRIMKMSLINYDNEDLYYSYKIMSNKKYLNSDEKRYKFKRHIKANNHKKKLAEIDLLSTLKTKKDFQIDMVVKEKQITDYLSSSFEQPKNIYMKSPNILKFDAKRNKKNFWGFINQPKSLASYRFSTLSNTVFPLAQSSNQIKEIEEFQHQNNKKSTFYNYYKSARNLKKHSNNDEIPLKKRIFSIFQMNSLKKIEEKNPKPPETEEIIELRKQKIEEIAKLKEEEALQKQKLAKKKIINKDFNINNVKINLLNKDNNTSIKEQKRFIEEQIKKGNFTTDVNGNIVVINEIKPDKLIEDLPTLYTKCKEIQNRSNNIELNQEKKNNELELINNNNIIYKNKRRTSMMNFRFKNTSLPEYLNYRIEPSGSNFELIKPEVGVVVQEKTKSKSGGHKFYEKYKKFSLSDFNKTLKETLDNEKQDYKEKMMETFNKTADLKSMISFKRKSKNINNISTKNIQNENDLFDKTFTNGIRKEQRDKTNKINNLKSLNKSQSGILLKNQKYSLLGELFVYDKSDYKSKIMGKEELNKINQKNLFLKKLNRKKNTIKESLSYRLVDSFNKSIVLGSKNKINDYISFPIMKNLPIIPLKRNKNNLSMEKYFNSTNINSLRTRIKKN